MRNILQNALREYLHQHADNRETMSAYHEQFQQMEESSAEALKMYADLVFSHGIGLDASRAKIEGAVLIGIGSTFKHLCCALDFAQYGKEQTEINLNTLTQKSNHEINANGYNGAKA